MAYRPGNAYSDALEYHEMEMKEDPLVHALNMLYQVSTGGIRREIEDRKEAKEDEKFNRRLRLDEVSRLRTVNPEIDPYNFGNVVLNEEDFLEYKNEINTKQNMKQQASIYQTEGGVLSKEAERDMFTYGETRKALDTSPGILAMDDLLNFDAWLLGERGHGRSIAKRHNHEGILQEYNDDLGGYVLDEGDYRDLLDKGLVTNLIPDTNGLYILNEMQKDKITRNYTYWREGFVENNELPKRSDIRNMISTQNMADFELEDKLRKNKKYEALYDRIEHWNDFMSPKANNALVDDDYNFTTDYMDPTSGEVERDNLSQKEFMEQYPLVYNFITGHTNIESAAAEYIGSEELRNQLHLIPQLHSNIYQKLQDLNEITQQRSIMGLDVNKYQYINDSQVMGDARDIVLNDLSSAKYGNGVLYDMESFDRLGKQQKDNLISKMIKLEKSYVNEKSYNYNPNVAAFLQLYGLGQQPAGMALENLLDELRGR